MVNLRKNWNWLLLGVLARNRQNFRQSPINQWVVHGTTQIVNKHMDNEYYSKNGLKMAVATVVVIFLFSL